MQQALDHLAHLKDEFYEETVDALKAALEQPEQEPTCPECKAAVLYECVACSSNNYPPKPEQEPTQWRDMVVVNLVREGINKHKARELADHFTTPPAAQPEQVNCPRCGHVCSQRPWVGLTDDQIDEIAVIARRGNLHDLRIAIEAKLKERNT
jgi:hypothetical protein